MPDSFHNFAPVHYTATNIHYTAIDDDGPLFGAFFRETISNMFRGSSFQKLFIQRKDLIFSMKMTK